ncbi:MAG: DUF4272 domain-containing protein [Myxococcota bacterium]|jgi:hypothetical protein|nr:DUF4272 domain-containing protein [Myxococcota bacterium]
MIHSPLHAPPTAERAYRRARVLLAVTARALFELLPERWPEIVRLRAWMMRESLWPEAEPSEIALLNAAPGGLASRDAIDGGWRIEGVAVLCWSLGLAPLPALDEQAEPSRYRACLGFLAPAPAIEVALRAEPELATYFEQTAHDRRLLLHHLELAARLSQPSELAGSEPDELAHAALTIDGRPVTESGDDEVRRVASAAHERCIAAGWLLGRAPMYADVAATL